MPGRFVFQLARLAVLAGMALVTISDQVLAERRVALVIGISSYVSVQQLPNPVRDAAAVADLFKAAGFAVDSRNNLTGDELRRAIREFSLTTRDADVAVVFFAGHGIEVGGINYLIPA